MGRPFSPIARAGGPKPRVAPAADGSASCGGGDLSGSRFRCASPTKVCAASVLPGTFANSACVGPVQGVEHGRGNAAPKSSSICVGFPMQPPLPSEMSTRGLPWSRNIIHNPSEKL